MTFTRSAILGLLFTFLSAQALALTVEFDRCAGLRQDPRAYQECQAHFGKAGTQASFKTYMCLNKGSTTPYLLEIKGPYGQYKVREQSLMPWTTPAYEIFENDTHALLGTSDGTGAFEIRATCELR